MMFSTSGFSIEIERPLSTCSPTCIMISPTCIMISPRCTEHTLYRVISSLQAYISTIITSWSQYHAKNFCLTFTHSKLFLCYLFCKTLQISRTPNKISLICFLFCKRRNESNLLHLKQICTLYHMEFGGKLFDLSPIPITTSDRWRFPKRFSTVRTSCGTDFLDHDFNVKIVLRV